MNLRAINNKYNNRKILILDFRRNVIVNVKNLTLNDLQSLLESLERYFNTKIKESVISDIKLENWLININLIKLEINQREVKNEFKKSY